MCCGAVWSLNVDHGKAIQEIEEKWLNRFRLKEFDLDVLYYAHVALHKLFACVRVSTGLLRGQNLTTTRL